MMAISDAAGQPQTSDLGVAAKLLRFHWLLCALIALAAATGVALLYSAAGGAMDPWARAHLVRSAFGLGVMLLIALIDLRFWRRMAPLLFLGALALLVLVALAGTTVNNATRWIRIGGVQLQPSEFAKIGVIAALAALYHVLPPDRRSRPHWVLAAGALIAAPMLLTLRQPDLGTALMIAAGGAAVMFLAGVNWRWFAGAATVLALLIALVLISRGESWQILKDYQFERIDAYLDPDGARRDGAYQVTQSATAFGAGGLLGRGFLEGSQTRLGYIPEKHNDFIFATLGEEFGLLGAGGLLFLQLSIVATLIWSATAVASEFGRLLASGVAALYGVHVVINMAMVVGLAPVVGVPLPLVSYGGTSLLAFMIALGLALSAHVHRDDPIAADA